MSRTASSASDAKRRPAFTVSASTFGVSDLRIQGSGAAATDFALALGAGAFAFLHGGAFSPPGRFLCTDSDNDGADASSRNFDSHDAISILDVSKLTNGHIVETGVHLAMTKLELSSQHKYTIDHPSGSIFLHSMHMQKQPSTLTTIYHHVIIVQHTHTH